MFKIPDVKGANILIVDDQQVNIQLLERLLEGSGYTRVSSTTMPQDVTALHLATPFDLILLDLQMPTMDGFEVMAALQALQPGDYLPVIVLTAQPTLKLRALDAGVRDFISKPFDLLEVNTRIRNMLEVRLLYKELAHYNEVLEDTVRVRTAELRASEARYRRLMELASDWHWEQDAQGQWLDAANQDEALFWLMSDSSANPEPVGLPIWDKPRQTLLRAIIAERKPFLDFIISRTGSDGKRSHFRISGEPTFDPNLYFSGYRCTGVEFSPETLSLEAGR